MIKRCAFKSQMYQCGGVEFFNESGEPLADMVNCFVVECLFYLNGQVTLSVHTGQLEVKQFRHRAAQQDVSIQPTIVDISFLANPPKQTFFVRIQ